MMTEEQQKLVEFLEEKIVSLRFAVKQNAFEKIRPELKHELECSEIALSALTQPASTALKLPDGLNETTAKLVISFATALAEKLHLSEVKYGWSDAWKNPGWQDKCLADFNHHIGKGDPRDVAAYCAFMWFHGWTTSRLNAPHTAPIEPICATGGAEWVKVSDVEIEQELISLQNGNGQLRGESFYREALKELLAMRSMPIPDEFLNAQQNASGMFELSEDCMCQMLNMLCSKP